MLNEEIFCEKALTAKADALLPPGFPPTPSANPIAKGNLTSYSNRLSLRKIGSESFK